MPKENKTVELKDEDLEKVSGGGRNQCPNNFSQCSAACAGCNNLVAADQLHTYKCSLGGTYGQCFIFSNEFHN